MSPSIPIAACRICKGLILGTSGPVWQEESLDHVLRSDDSLQEKCDYIAQNPVRAGLVRKPED